MWLSMTKSVPAMALCSPSRPSKQELTIHGELDQPVGQPAQCPPSTLPASITTECLKFRGEWPKAQGSVLRALMGTEVFEPNLGQ